MRFGNVSKTTITRIFFTGKQVMTIVTDLGELENVSQIECFPTKQRVRPYHHPANRDMLTTCF